MILNCRQCGAPYGGSDGEGGHCTHPGCHRSFSSNSSFDAHFVGYERRHIDVTTTEGWRQNRKGYWTNAKENVWHGG